MTLRVHNVAVWTAGHVKLNGTRQVYVWSRNSYVTKMNLQENEPIMTGCIEIDSQSMFRDWIVVNCSRENYFICSRPTEMGELENVQCMCHNGYRGNFCDQSFSEFGISFESQSVACIDNEFEFSCPNGRSIQVDFAAYGNIGVSRELCLSSTQVEVNATDWEVCVHPSSLQTMISMCQGLTYCRISDLQSLFPDSPCLPTTPIILQYRMRCLFEPLIRCPLSAVYLNGRCYVPHVTDEPLSLFNAQTKCRKEGGQLASSVDQSARNEIAATVQKKVRYDSGACYWISEPRGCGLEMPLNGSLCECYYITNNNAFWSQRNCSSSQQWVCQFAPEIVTFRPTEIYDKLMEQRIVFSGISNVESVTSVSDNQRSLRMKRSFCEKYEWNGITFPRTLACSVVQIPCPDPENTIAKVIGIWGGTAKWNTSGMNVGIFRKILMIWFKGVTTHTCNCESGRWEGKPDTRNCTHKWIKLLDQLIDNESPAENISGQWAQFLQPTEQLLFGGDVVRSIDIGKKLLSLAKMQYTVLDDRKEQNDKAVEFTKMYGEAGNELLSDHAAPVWMSLPDDVRIDQISSLITLLEQSAELMSQFLIDKQMKINYSNWAFEVQLENSISPTVRSNHMTVHDNAKTRLARRSHGFHANSNVAYNDALTGNVTFNFPLSPVLLMPPLKVLKHSVQAAILFSTLNGSGVFARPRAGFSPFSSSRSPLLLGYYVFRSVGTLLNINKTTVINSLVIGASVNDPTSSIPLPNDYPVNLKFYHIRTNDVDNARCVFWDTSIKAWNEEGCKTLRTQNDSTECSCTHLTSFAILMDITGVYSRDKESVVDEILNLTTIVGCAISIACLFLASLVFTCFRSLWSIRILIHRNLCFCLLLAELVFVVGIDRTENKVICRAVAVALHYLFLAAFCWMLLEGYQLYLMLVQVFDKEEGKTVLYCLYAYGFPAVIVAVTAGVAWSNYSTDQYCWLNVEAPTIWAFAGPIAVIIVSNIVILGVALRVVLSVRSRHRSRTVQMLGWLKGSGSLLCLLGVTWIFGYLMVIQGAESVFAYIFTVLNCLQGMFIFVIHVVLNDKVRLTVLRSLRVRVCYVSDPNPTKTPSIVGSRQQLIDMIRNNELSHGSSRARTRSSDLRSASNSNKGVFVEKALSRTSGTGSPTTVITYLDWKTKVSNDSGSIPSDDSGNFDCEMKETLPFPADIEITADQSQRDSDINNKEKCFPTRRKICCSNEDRCKSKRKEFSAMSTAIERF
uniref:Uncharacterized protein n=1 Tax=Setaria digitata TaxID=48799 RepID=A0A915PTL3_9BILA